MTCEHGYAITHIGQDSHGYSKCTFVLFASPGLLQMYIADTFPNAPHYVTPSCFPPHHLYPTIVVIAPMYVYLYFTISFTVHSLLREMPAHGGGGRRAGGKTRNAWCKTDVTVWLTPHLTSLPLLSSPFITPTHLAILLDLASALQSENENVSTIQTQC